MIVLEIIGAIVVVILIGMGVARYVERRNQRAAILRQHEETKDADDRL